jgi:hypothetical protein
MSLPVPDTSTLIALCAIAVHADELTSPDHERTQAAIEADSAAIRGLLANPAVSEYLASVPSVLLPVKRSENA